MNKIRIVDLSVKVEGKIVLNKVSLELKSDEIVVLLGANGAGKSTLMNVIMGHPKYEVISGKIFNDMDITNLSTHDRVKLGIFMTFQNPVEVSGVSVLSLLRQSYNVLNQTNISLSEFVKLLNSKMTQLGIDSSFRGREFNVNFSGGEKKKFEILQLILNEPSIVMLDELDSGLDIDAVKLLSDVILKLKNDNKTGVLIITHNYSILDFLNVDRVYVLEKGKIKEVGDRKIIDLVKLKGFNKDL